MSVEIIKEGELLFPSIYSFLNAKGVDFSKNLVVFSGKRPAFFLIQYMKEKLKKSFISPYILSIDEFIDYCCQKELKLSHKKIDALSACSIIRELIAKEGIYPDVVDNLNKFLPLGIKLFTVFEELYIENITAERLKQEDYEINAPITLDRLYRLSHIYNAFYERVEKAGFTTRAMEYKKIANDGIFLKEFEKIIFAGFFALTSSERKIFKNLVQDDRVIFIFQSEAARNYAFDGKYAPFPIDVEKITLFECPDGHSQVFKLSQLIKQEEQNKKKGERVLIVVPSNDLLIPLINSLQLKQEEYNISMGYPLTKTPLFTFIKHLFDVLTSKRENRVYLPDYLKFMLHPYTKNIMLDGNAEVTRILLHTIEDELNLERYKSFMTLEEIENLTERESFLKVKGLEKDQEKLKKHLQFIHNATLREFETIENIKSFAKKLKKLINFVYEKSTAKRHVLFFPYCERMLEAFTELENSLIASDYFKDNGDYFDFFTKFLSLYYVPFKGTPIKDIQLLGFLETRNLVFENVYILDMNEGVIPDTKREDSLLPYDVRMRLGIPTHKEREMIYDYHLRNLIAGAKKVIIFYQGKGNKEKSRFVERIIWEKQKKVKMLDNTYFSPLSYRFTLKPFKPVSVEKDDKIIDILKNFTFSATSLDVYYQCPLNFYYKYILLPQKEETLSEELESKDIGNIVHTILKDYYEDKEISYNERKFNKIVDAVFNCNFGTLQKGGVLITKYQIKKRLSDLIKNYRKITSCEKIEIIDLERELYGEVILNGGQRIKIKGRIDRIEKRDGEVYIVDYKTSADSRKYKVRWENFQIDNRDCWDKAFRTIQLIFYVVLAKKSQLIKAESVTNASVILLKNISEKDMEIRLFSNEEERGVEFHLEEIVKKLIEEIIALPHFSPAKDKKVCEWCDFKYICWK